MVTTLLTALVLSTVTAVVAQGSNKYLLERFTVIKVVCAMYSACFIFVITLAFMHGHLTWEWPVVLMGFINAAVAAWFFNRAMQLGLARTILVLPLTGIVAIFLSAIFIREWQLLNPYHWQGVLRIAGVVVSLGAAVLLSDRSNSSRERSSWQWLWLVVGAIITIGTLNFFIKYFALQRISESTYLLSWYTGTFLGAGLLWLFDRSNKNQVFSWGDRGMVVVDSMGVIATMAINFWLLRRVPATIFYPLQTFFNVVGSGLVGLYFFHERKNLVKHQWIGMAIGIIGVVFLTVASI